MATKKTIKSNITTSDLGQILATKRQELRDLNFKGAGSKVSNVKAAKKLRQEIARALTMANSQPVVKK